MTWEIWFTIGIALILIGAVIWAFVGIKKKEDSPVRLSKYLFAYRIKEEDDTRAMPTVFLENWEISNLENHLYLLYLNLEEDLDIEEYLHKVWVDYEGFDDVYIDVYRIEGMMDTKHTLIGKFCIIEGKMGYTPV